MGQLRSAIGLGLLCVVSCVSAACTPFSGYTLGADSGKSMSLPETAADGGDKGNGTDHDAGASRDAGRVITPLHDAGTVPNQPDAAADGGGHTQRHDAAPSSDDDGGHPLVHIVDCNGLAAMGADLLGNYVLDNDVSCVGFDDGTGSGFFHPIGSTAAPFRGTFDGAGHSISNLGISHDTDTGLFGVTRGAFIRRVAIEGATVSAGARCGVLIGRATEQTVVQQVFVSGTVSVVGLAGGVVGELQASRLEDVHANVTVASTQLRAGLLVGAILQGSSVVRSYSNGVVTGQMGALAIDELDGSTVQSSFYDCSLAHGCADANQRGLRTVELRVAGRFVYAGWDYATPVWGRPASAGGPCLSWEKGCSTYSPPGLVMSGDGSATSPYHVQSCAHLQLMAAKRSAAYVLDNDIACGGFDMGDGQGFWPVGNAYDAFRGSFDGNGFVVRGLRIMRPHQNDVGLFGVAAGATINRVSVMDATILGHSSVGVVVGRSQHATIGGCSVGGRLGAHDSAGGAVGMNQDGTPAPVCASSVLITSLQ